MASLMRTLIFILALLVTAPLAASAQTGASPASVRLLDGAPEGEVLGFGVDIRLQPGWKTYWSNPGDSGVPPRFDWSGSENVARVEVAYPAPRRFRDGGAWSIGYAERVIFPVSVVPEDPARPVRLVLDLDYAVCRDICVPAEASLEITRERDAAPSRFAAAEIAAFRARVPEPDHAASPAIQPLGLRDGTLTIAVALPGPVDLLADGAQDWQPPLPVAAGRDADGRALFTLALKKAPAKGALHLVAVTGGRALARILPLDALAATP